MWFLWLTAALAQSPQAQVVSTVDEIVVDGRLDEPAWATAPPVTDFTRYIPTQGGPPAGTTEVRFLQDARTLYVGIRVSGVDYAVRARIAAREDVNADDQIGLYLDPFGTAQVGYIFYTNAIGIQQDIQWIAGRWNTAWNTVYKTKGRVTDDGYELEIALPFRSLKYPKGIAEQEWGLVITRKVPSEGAKYAFPKVSRGHPRWFQQAVPLVGVRPPSKPSGVEIIPGLTVRFESNRDTVADEFVWTDFDPWYEPIRPSVDLRAGLSPTTALIAAVNPDFSQVESDIAPLVLNARFAFRFDERRPFFTEGAGFFDDVFRTLYTRSVVEPLGGLKVAGREGNWSFGVLHALDRSPQASFHEDAAPGFRPDEVQGRWAHATVARITHDLPRSGYVGLTLTDKRLVQEAYAEGDPDRPSPGAHSGLGLDTSVPIGEHWTLQAGHALSLTQGGDEHLGGMMTTASMVRPSGEGLGADIRAETATDGFRQEVGFRNQSGYVTGSAQVDWTFAGRGKVSTWAPRVTAAVFEEFRGESYREVAVESDLLVDGVHRLRLDGGLDQRREGHLDVRGEGGPVAEVPGWFARARYAGQIGAVVELYPQFRVGREMAFDTLAPATRMQAQLDATLRPLTWMRLDLLGRWTRLVPEGAGAKDDWLARGRLQLQFNQQWGIRLISQYTLRDAQEGELDSSALVTWLLHPFTAVYAGYAERTQLGERPGTLDRAVFAKVQVMIRP